MVRRRRLQFNSGKRKRFDPRKMGHEGRNLEDRVAQILANLWHQGEITRFECFAPNSKEDREGKDFLVVINVNGVELEYYFGVTISKKAHEKSSKKHSEIPNLHIPCWSNDEFIGNAILSSARFTAMVPTPV